MEIPGIHHEKLRVRHREADRNGNLKLSSWFDFLQEAAANHAARLGVGLGALQKSGELWVLSRLKLGIRRYPAIGEELTVETYPSGFNRLFANRQFRISDVNGETVAVASSAWLLLSAEKLRPIRPDTLPVTWPDNRSLPTYYPLADKIPQRELPEDFTVSVRPSMEDVNGHLNNAEYAGLVQDFAAGRLGVSPLFETVELHFLAAVRAPGTLAVGGEINGGELFVEGRTSSGNISFAARARFHVQATNTPCTSTI